jgi:beta-galactosidase
MAMANPWRRLGWTALLALAAAAAAAPAPRATVDLNGGWRFLRQDVAGADAVAFDDGAWQAVDLPHTWNNQDGEDGGNDYHRGPGWYRRRLPADPAWAGKRVYLRVGAANTDAAVYVNGKPVGTHKGGFSAFTFDLTPLLNLTGENELAVRVDNARDADVPPLSADFTFFGGLYRGVQLIVTDPLSVSPLDDGSDGVYVRQDAVSADEAKLTVTTVVRNAGPADRTATVHCDVAGVTADAQRAVPAGGSVNVEQHIVVPHPHLWNGRKDPFEYPARVTVGDGATVTDAVEERVGLRSYRVDPQRGFFLNGEPYRLYGVNRHQDKLDKGWALSADDERIDFRDMMDLGCTGVRLSHYQQSPSFYGLMDQGGIVVWAEIPLVNEITEGSAAFADDAEQQLRELVKQNYNHPAICFWGLFNELRGGKAEPAEIALVRRLNDAAHRLDPTRLTTCASNQSVNGKLATVPDVAGYNRYTGWYGGHMDQWPHTLDEIHAAYPDRPCGMSEYGGGGAVTQHEAEPVKQPKANRSPWHPEEYQADLHEAAWAAMKDRPWLWGTFIWCLHDFASDGRKEGDHAGRNDKGLVTYDGKTRKDAFYFYQANWSGEPMVYVTDRRFTPRPAGVPVKVYSNCDSVELRVNGKSMGAMVGNDIHMFVLPKTAQLALTPGENRIEAVGTRGGATVTDGYTVVVDPKAQ